MSARDPESLGGPPAPLSAVLFDLDGVLVHSEGRAHLMSCPGQEVEGP
ncbi:hypothetical protein [Sorangium sp. So ce1078]